MKYTLTYKNKQGVEARLDIITHDDYSITEIIEGTDTPFILNYKREKNNKDGYIISSSADISIYESGTFNIDNLKTSNETDIKVEYYIDNVLMWSGFVVPDFFSREIGTPAIINMVASDRLGSLKGQTLDNLPATITLSSLVSSCLAKTGLSLPVNLKADFTSVAGNENIFSSKVLSQRFTDTKGRNISCYDILRSILVATNSIVVQRNGEWYVANKFQVEQEMVLPEQQYIDFNEVTVGARRQIVPVASSVGVYHEFGGGRLHPDNYDFHDNLTGWTAKNGFTMFWRNNEIIGWDSETNEPIYGNETENGFMINHKNRPLPLSFPWFDDNFDTWECAETIIPVVGEEGAIRVEVNINVSQFDRRAFMDYQVLAINGDTILALDPSGSFVDYDPNNINLSRRIIFKEEVNTGLATAYSKAEGTINRNDAADFDIKIRIFGGNIFSVLFINFVSVKFSSIQDTAKGIIYKTTQGNNFTKVHDTDTSIIGDYLTSGLNGYFYPYPIDDTSSLLTSSGNLTTRWTVPYSDEELPLLQHIARQRSRMFSVAHDLLSAEIDSDILDPLAIFRDCADKKYVMISGSQDFLRGVINVEIEEIAYDFSILKRDYIYSYFGEGEEGVSSVGGISEAAPGGGGGGMTPEQLEILSFWKKDPDRENTIFTEMNAYSKLELSAYGAGDGGGGGGGNFNRLDAWADYDSSKSGWVLSALLGVDLNTRLSNVESGSATSIVTTGSGNAITSISKSGNVITANKGSKFAELGEDGLILTSQLPSYVDDVLEFDALADFPTTGEPGKIYVATNTNLTYRWTGTTYVEISKSIALGTTSSTAYRGDHGLIAYNHSQSEHQTIINGTGFVKANGKTLSYDNTTYEPAFTKNTAFNKNFGTAAGTVAEGNDSRINNGQTAYGWGNHSDQNYFKSTFLRAFVVGAEGYDANEANLTGGFVGSYYSSDWLTNRAFDGYGGLITWNGTSAVGLKLQIQYDAGHSNPSGGRLAFRTSYNSSGEIFTNWKEIWHTGNLTSLSQLTDNIGVATHIANKANPHNVTKAQVGLGNVDNTADSVKNVLSATKLTTARTIAGVSFDGTANIAIPFANLSSKPSTLGDEVVTDAVTLNTAQTISGKKTFSDTVTAPTFSGALSGNASSATKLQTARTLTIGNTGKTFDGTANVSWSAAEMGVLPITGGAMANTNLVTNLNADLLDGLNSTDFVRSNSGNVSLSGFGGFQQYPNPKFVYRYLGYTDDTKASLILFARQYDGTVLDKEGFIGSIHFSRGSTAAYNITNNINISIATGYNTTLFNINGDYLGCKIITTTYNSEVYYGLYIPSSSTKSIYLSGWLYTEPIFIADASSYATTDVTSSGQNFYINNVEAATINSNVASATKLQTARTLWGRPFDGSGNVDGALTGVTTLTASTSVTVPKVIFAAAGWSVEQSGTEIQFKYNGTIKQRLLSDGSIVAVGEVTAYGATS